jgi:hypothetical protein
MRAAFACAIMPCAARERAPPDHDLSVSRYGGAPRWPWTWTRLSRHCTHSPPCPCTASSTVADRKLPTDFSVFSLSAFAQGQKACNDAVTLDPSASSLSCINPFYAEPLCDSACFINSLLTTVAAWFFKEGSEASARTAYSSTNTKVRCDWKCYVACRDLVCGRSHTRIMIPSPKFMWNLSQAQVQTCCVPVSIALK